MQGYYLKEYGTFSVRHYDGQWCCFCRMQNDILATTKEQIAAVLMWADANCEKFHSVYKMRISSEGRATETGGNMKPIHSETTNRRENLTATEIVMLQNAEMGINKRIVVHPSIIDAMFAVSLEIIYGTAKGKAVNKIINQPFFC